MALSQPQKNGIKLLAIIGLGILITYASLYPRFSLKTSVPTYPPREMTQDITPEGYQAMQEALSVHVKADGITELDEEDLSIIESFMTPSPLNGEALLKADNNFYPEGTMEFLNDLNELIKSYYQKPEDLSMLIKIDQGHITFESAHAQSAP